MLTCLQTSAASVSHPEPVPWGRLFNSEELHACLTERGQDTAEESRDQEEFGASGMRANVTGHQSGEQGNRKSGGFGIKTDQDSNPSSGTD